MATTKKKWNLGQRMRAYKKAKEKAEKIGNMTPAERKKLAAEGRAIHKEMQAEIDKLNAENAPSMDAAESDTLATLMAVGADFIARYYPQATRASFYVNLPGETTVSRVSIPMAVPTRQDAGKGGAA